MSKWLVFSAVFSLISSVSPAWASGDAVAGKVKSATCAGCHGMDGNSENVAYPKIGGQYADYMVRVLEDYRSGARSNAIMAGFAANLSDADLRNLAAWYASQSSSVYTVDRD